MTRVRPYAGAAMVVSVAAFSTVAASGGGEAALKLRMQMAAAPGQTLTLDLQRWSTDEERAPFLSALMAAPADDAGGRGPGGRGGTGAPARGRGAAPTPAQGRQGGAGDPGTADATVVPAAAPQAAPAGRGGAGRGGAAGARGARGGRGAAANVSPEARLAAAVKAAPTLGFVWGTGVTGYSVRYAWRSSANGRPERLVLITDRRLDIPTASGAPGAAVPPAGSSGDGTGDFTVIEIRVDAKGAGAGKTSITTSAIVDQTAGTIAVQNYEAVPLQLRITP
jgi:hypothetical protein